MKKSIVNDFCMNNSFTSKLSEKELEVLLMSCAGFSRDEIAMKLNVSVNTIGSHIKSSSKKYELDTFSQLKALFFFNFLRMIINHSE